MTAPPRSRLAIGLSALSLAVGTLAIGIAPASPAAAGVDPAAPIVVSEVYGGGGNSGATYTYDYVELYNTTGSAIDLTGYSVQYGAPTGTTYSRVALVGSIPATGYFLLRFGTGDATVGAALPVTPDQTSSTNIGGTNGKIALVDATVPAALTCGGDCDSAVGVVDFVGYGTANDFAGAAAPAGSNTTSVSRGATNTNTANNAADFAARAHSPRAPFVPPVIPDVGNRTIPEIQGTGAASPFAGSTATTRGVVTAVYDTGGLDGYVIQTPGTGGTFADRTASDGLFVFSSSTDDLVDVGQYVEVYGLVSEFNGLTEITVAGPDDLEILPDVVAAPTPIVGEWPATDTTREAAESMLYRPTGTYTVTNTFTTNTFGAVGLAFGDEPLRQPTDVVDFDTPGAVDQIKAENYAKSVVIDDGGTFNYTNPANQSLTPPYVSLTNPVRIGATANLVGTFVVDFRNNLWTLQPPKLLSTTNPSEISTFTNTREPTPDAASLGNGSLSVASFNVLNYFTTLGTDSPTCVPFNDRAGNGITVNEGCDQRGAWDAASLARQQVKIVNAINTLDASVVGLMEIENSARLGEPADEALATLVGALNAAAGSLKWTYVPSSTELPQNVGEQDVITNAIIYQVAEVEPVGAPRALGNLSSGTGAFNNAREPIGQAFAPRNGGEPFFVAVNHFKSKSSGAEADTGQGAFNQSRVAQATALRDWVDSVLDSYSPAITDSFLVGDFNSYTMEDPLQVLYAAGYADSNELRGEAKEYSYSFSDNTGGSLTQGMGLSGSLDHVLVNAGAQERMTGADIWEINSAESIALEYSRYNSHGTLFYDESPFRSSDHDPVIVAFDVADYNPVGPLRVFDTRPGESPQALRVVPKTKVSGDPALSVTMTNLGGVVPSSGVGAVSLNVTVTGSTVPGFVTVYSCGTRRLISSVNFAAGQTTANAVVTPVSETGNVCFFSNTPVDIIVDVNGWFAEGEAFNSVGPERVFDTRPGNSPDAVRTVAKQMIGGDTTLRVKFTDIADLVPATGVGTVSINVTVTGATVPGFVTVYPCGQRSEVSSVNFAAGQTVANAVITRVSEAGEVCFFSNTPVDVVADVNGWFPVGEGFTSIEPQRLFDTRAGEGAAALRDVPKTQVGGSTTLEVRANGLSGLIPTEGVSAVSLNVAVTGATVPGFVTVYPCGTLPPTSSVNFLAGQTVANAVIAPLSSSGTVCFFSNTPVDLVVDVNGFFDAATNG